MFAILSSTGNSAWWRGYKMSTRYKLKKEEVEEWKEEWQKDKDEHIRNFVKEYLKYLDKKIAQETRSAEREIEHRKQEFEE